MRRILILLAVLLLCGAGGYLFWGRSRRAEFEARVAALKAAGEPVAWEDLLPPPVPPDQDAAPLLRRADEVHEGNDPWDDLAQEWKEWTPEMWEEVRAYVARNVEYGRLLEEAAARPECRPPLELENGWPREPLIHTLQQAAEFLRYRALLEAHDGDPAAALRTLQVLFRLGRHAPAHTLIGMLVGMTVESYAVHVLFELAEQPGVPAAYARAIFDGLLSARSATDLRDVMRGERVGAIEVVGRLLRGEPMAPVLGGDDLPTPLLGPLLWDDAILLLDDAERMIAIVGWQYPAAESAARDLAREVEERDRWRHPLSPLWAVLAQKIVYAGAAHDARMRGARIALALLEARTKDGAWPATLYDLTPGFVDATPVDPFTSEIFHYTATGDTAVLEAAVPIRPEQEAVREELEIKWVLRVP